MLPALACPVVGPRHISTSEPRAEDLEPVASAVVKHPDAELRVVHCQCANDRPFEN